ncbi:MAG: hypothetical protein WDM92_07180 [Caulobacteraceae bacterium]
MFEFGRELRRLFMAEPSRDPAPLADPAPLERLDLKLLRKEAGAADAAAGRPGKGRPERLVEASAVWRELARRTGDPAALRKAAVEAELAAAAFGEDGCREGLGQAMAAQAAAAMLGADLLGQERMNAVASRILKAAPDICGVRAARARLLARKTLAAGGLDEVRTAAARYDAALAGLDARDPGRRYAAAQLRRDRAELLIACGGRQHEPHLVEQALADLDKAAAGLDPTTHPVTLARIATARGEALVRLAEMDGDVSLALEAVDVCAEALDLAGPGHSPLDWARAQHGRASALMTVGLLGESEAAFERALDGLGRALSVVGDGTAPALRAGVAQDRAACLVRRAELRGDAFALDEAEAVLRSELSRLPAAPDPTAWGLLQLNLARIYLARWRGRGSDRGERASAGEALAAALDVFTERGQRSLALIASAELERLRDGAIRPV